MSVLNTKRRFFASGPAVQKVVADQRLSSALRLAGARDNLTIGHYRLVFTVTRHQGYTQQEAEFEI